MLIYQRVYWMMTCIYGKLMDGYDLWIWFMDIYGYSWYYVIGVSCRYLSSAAWSTVEHVTIVNMSPFQPFNIAIITIMVDISRRKFRSQTSDNMNRWKAEMGRVREEKRRRKKIKKRKFPKKEDPGVRKGRKSRETQCFLNDLWLRRVEQ